MFGIALFVVRDGMSFGTGGYTSARGLYAYRTCRYGLSAYIPVFPSLFEIPSQAAFERDVASPLWVNIVYPHYGATLWCSYVALTTENKEAFYAESRDLVYVHAAKASSITAQSYADDERRVYAVLYNLSGQAATPLQFVVTDSAAYLFRGALYFDTPVRRDSVAPIVDYITDDVVRLIETLQLRN